ncbi:MAG: hypothetical protein ED859_07930 [Desulfuromonadales bacterium]|nr:MAG: hypothetical protein ED859_07930 [Desulfuromonadales bacterium]
MKRFLGRKKNAEQTEEKISDAMLGTGEAMCTCAALVADMIVDAGQEGASVSALLEKVKREDAVPPEPSDSCPKERP